MRSSFRSSTYDMREIRAEVSGPCYVHPELILPVRILSKMVNLSGQGQNVPSLLVRRPEWFGSGQKALVLRRALLTWKANDQVGPRNALAGNSRTPKLERSLSATAVTSGFSSTFAKLD